MAVTEADVVAVLRGVSDPDLFKDLVALQAVKGVRIVEGNVAVEVSTASPHKERIRAEIVAAVGALEGVEEVFVNFTTSLGTAPGQKPPAGPRAAPPAPKKVLGSVKHIVAVGAGKGGVGKSTVAVNIAVGLALAGEEGGSFWMGIFMGRAFRH